MSFAVGDKVVHPGIGAGRITGTKHQELVTGFKHYYVIEIPSRNSTVYVPMRNAEELGMRLVMSRGKLARVLHTLASKPHPLPETYKERQEAIEEKLKTDRPIVIAEAVRDLTGYERVASLNSKDKELLSRGWNLLAGEIALVTEAQVDDVNALIGEKLAASMLGQSG
jgi:CarD family transcriptional regulator